MRVQSMHERRENLDPVQWVNKQHEIYVRNNYKWLDSDAASKYHKKYIIR